MPKVRIDRLDDYQPYKKKFPKRKDRHEEFKRDSSKRNKRDKKNGIDRRS